MGLFRSRELLGIAADTLEFARSAAAETHPNEYMGLLRSQPADELDLDDAGSVITDVLVIPGTESNPVSATVKTSLVPNDMRAAGSIHSHPNGVLRPSAEDRATFRDAAITAWDEFATTDLAKKLVAQHKEFLTQLGLFGEEN